ncbi:MAG TPA: CHAT domain-containing protein, partial [Thermoanaerobaculia bacterium]|nr:CHAT domain-containing protein [Thermoanaerobaculia bacterium]
MSAFPLRGAVTVTVSLAAAAVAAILYIVPSRDTGVAALVRASEGAPHRPILARLSGGFPYRIANVLRGPGDDTDTQNRLEFLSAAAKIQKKVAADRSVENLHALGVAYLLLHDPTNATVALENALTAETHAASVFQGIPRSKNAELLSDLAAAYYTRQGSAKLTFQAKAVEAVQGAWRLKKTPEIAWNRALIIESLHIREDAREAWEQCLKLDAGSQWSAEAQRRLDDLARAFESERWPAAQRQLASMPLNRDALIGAINPFRQQVRVWCEDELLPSWGEASLKGDPQADELLRRAMAIGAALEAANGESVIRRAAEAIRNARREDVALLARGHIAFGKGRRAFLNSKSSECLRWMTNAVSELRPALTPFAVRAQSEQAAAIFMLNDYPRAQATVQHLLREQQNESATAPGVMARLHWLAGVLNWQTGNPAEAARHCQLALDLFQRIGERDYEAVLHTIVADILVTEGKRDEAREHRDQALALLDQTGNERYRHGIIFEAAYAAIMDTQPALAELLIDRVVTHDVASRNPVNACTSLMWRSAYRASRRASDLAQRDLSEARGFCENIDDPAVRERSVANLSVADGIVARDRGATPDPRQLDAAISYFERTQSRLGLRTAYLTRARAHAAARNDAAAEGDFRAAIEQSEATRDRIDEADARVSFTATADEVVDAYVEFLIDRRRETEALEIADRSRSRELVDSPSAQWAGASTTVTVAPFRTTLSSNVTVIEYRVLDSRVMAWVLRRESLETIALPITVEDVTWLVDELRDGSSSTRWLTACSSLYDGLLRPLQAAVDPSSALVVVPDDVIERVPFAALYDSKRGQYVVQGRSSVIVPSISLFAASASRFESRTKPQDRVLVVSAPTAGDSSEILDAASREGELIAKEFPATVLTRASSPKQVFDLVTGATMLHFAGHAVAGTTTSSPRELILGEGKAARLGVSDVLSEPLKNVR